MIGAPFSPAPFAYRPDRTIADAAGVPLARCYADRNEAANGPLFAASGALYDTLQEILDNRFFRQAHPALRVKARAALALARGEQS